MNARKFVPQKHFVDRFPSFSTTEGCHRSIFLCMLETSKRRGGFQNESNNHRQLYCTEAACEESHAGTVSRKARCVEQDHLHVGERAFPQLRILLQQSPCLQNTLLKIISEWQRDHIHPHGLGMVPFCYLRFFLPVPCCNCGFAFPRWLMGLFKYLDSLSI